MTEHSSHATTSISSDLWVACALAAIGLVTWQFVPDFNVGPYDAIYPLHALWMALLVAGLHVLGRILGRLLAGRWDLLVTGAVGGLISSTAVVVSLSKQARGHHEQRPQAVIGILVACTMMLVRVLVALAAVDLPTMQVLLPSVIAAIVGGLGFIAWKVARTKASSPEILGEQQLQAKPEDESYWKTGAVFGLLYAAISLIVAWSQHQWGDTGVYLTSLIAGTNDVDAITLSTAAMRKREALTVVQASIAIWCAVASNTAIKLALAFGFGGARLARSVGAGFFWTLAPAALWLALRHWLQ